jgi:LPS sulfotransferase NodH
MVASHRLRWAGASFEDKVADAAEDGDLTRGFCRWEGRVRQDYLILFNGRSGSTWLTGLLTGRLGTPQEYFNPGFVSSVAATLGTRDPELFVRALRGKTGCNGYFGAEATSEHIAFFGEDRLFGLLRRPVIFHLWRDNLVGQAVSLFQAVTTGRFHRIAGEEKPEAAAHPRYDGPAIASWFRYLAAVENGNFELLARRNLTAVPLVYEFMIANPDLVLAAIGGALRASRGQLGTVPDSPFRRNTDAGWAAEMEARFRKENAGLVADVLAERLAPPLHR